MTHPKWQALQSEFGITCDVSIANTLNCEASRHICHSTAEENPIWPLNMLESSLNKGILHLNALLFHSVRPFDHFATKTNHWYPSLHRTYLKKMTASYWPHWPVVFKLCLTVHSLWLISHAFRGWVWGNSIHHVLDVTNTGWNRVWVSAIFCVKLIPNGRQEKKK